MTNTSGAKRERLVKWLKRIGVGGFLFFLLKGLVWVGVFIFYWLIKR